MDGFAQGLAGTVKSAAPATFSRHPGGQCDSYGAQKKMRPQAPEIESRKVILEFWKFFRAPSILCGEGRSKRAGRATCGNGNRIGGQGGREQDVHRAPKMGPPQRADASVDG